MQFIALDVFKEANDNLEHRAGDHVLKRIAECILLCVLESDTVARVGGDESLIIVIGLYT